MEERAYQTGWQTSRGTQERNGENAEDRMQVTSRFWLLEQPRRLDLVESLTNKQTPGSKGV